MAELIDANPQPSLSPSDQNDGGIRNARDFKLSTLNLLASGSSLPVNLLPMFIELNYHEDLFSPAATGTLLISDAQGIIEKLSFCGNEYVRFVVAKDVETPDNPEVVVDKLFRVYKITNRQRATGDLAENFVLHLCSDELFMSEQYRISKSYVGMGVKDIVDDIMTNYVMAPTDKYDIANLEDTDGVYSFIVPNFKPFEAINWLMQFAKPANGNVGNDMVFFESGKSYFMASLQTLFNNDSLYTLSYEPTNIKGKSIDDTYNVARNFFNVITYEIVRNFDSLEGVKSGMFANRLITLDPIRLKANTIDFNYSDYTDQATQMNQFPKVTNTLQNRNQDAIYETPEAVLRMTVTNSQQDENAYQYAQDKPGALTKDVFIEDVLTMRKAQLNLSNYHKVKLFVGGNPYYKVGQKMYFDLNSISPGSEDNPKQPDNIYSGYYLVSGVRHKIMAQNYTTVLEVIKESINGSQLTEPDNGQLWQNTTQGVKD
jgi:hypothetical protein